jgi:hypothetical protein
MSKPFESHRRLLGCDAIVDVLMSQIDQNMVDHDATGLRVWHTKPPPDNMGFPMMSTETLSIDPGSNRVYTSGLEGLGNT